MRKVDNSHGQNASMTVILLALHKFTSGSISYFGCWLPW